MDFETWWNRQMNAGWWETQTVWPSEYNTAKAAWHAALQSKQEEPCKRCGSYKTLVESLESQIAYHRKKANEYFAAISTLESEREANEILTNELEDTMNFRDYWLTHQDGGLMPHIDVAEEIWNAAQEAERRRIYQILDRVAIDANHSQWFDCCDTIVERIKNG